MGLKPMTSDRTRHFYAHWLAKTFPSFAVLVLVLVVFLIQSDKTAFTCALLLMSLFLWWAVSDLRLRVTLDNAGLHQQGYLFVKPRTLRWDQIKAIRKHINPYGWPIFLIIPRERGLKGFPIGPEIKGYKHLLKEILLRVPPDTEIDPQVLHLTKFLDSPEGHQRLSEIREQSGRSAS